METIATVKLCTKCKKKFPATTEFFHKRKTGKFGLRSCCKTCALRYINIDYKKQWDDANPLYGKKYYEQNKGKILKQQKGYYKENIEKILERVMEYRRTSKGRKIHADSDRKYRKNNRLSCCIASLMRQSLKGNKNGWHWEMLVSYDCDQLARYLQKTIGLTDRVVLPYFWKYFYGKYYHIDHKKPISLFNREKLQCPTSKEFKECCALNNLQLLTVEENLRKGSKYDFRLKGI